MGKKEKPTPPRSTISNCTVQDLEQRNDIQDKRTVSNDTIQDTRYIDFLIAEYQVLAERRTNHNSLLWSIPPLLFVAQTALWVISFNSSNDSNPIICIVISLFSAFVGVASLQCFLRNRLMEIADAEQAYIIECAFKEKYEKLRKDNNFPIPILIINHKRRYRTWYNVNQEKSIIEGSSKCLKDFTDSHKNFKSRLYEMHSSDIWKWVFIISIILPILNALYIVYRAFLTT